MVILATDADVDGTHIRNLMITHFFRSFDQLAHDGRVDLLGWSKCNMGWGHKHNPEWRDAESVWFGMTARLRHRNSHSSPC